MIWEHLLNPGSSGRLCLTLAHSWWQFALLALLAYLYGRFRSTPSSERQYTVSVATLFLGLLALPVTYLLLDAPPVNEPLPVAQSRLQPIDVLPAQPQPESLPIAIRDAAPEVTSITAVLHELNISEPASGPPTLLPVTPLWLRIAPWLAGAYSLGVVLMLVRLIAALTFVQRLLSRSRRVTEPKLVARFQELGRRWSLRVVPTLMHAQRIVVPKVVGLLRPTIVLPTSLLSGLSPQELDLILAHEIAHLRRYDLAIQLVQRLAEVVLFFNPALWYLSRRISTLREFCCDELVCRSLADVHGEPRRQYACALLRIAELAHAALSPNCAAVGAWHNDLATLAASGRSPSELRRRIASLFGEAPCEPLPISRGGVWIILCVTVLGIIGPVTWSSLAESKNTGNRQALNKPEKAEASDQDIHLFEEGVVTGVLVRASDGSPVADATVILHTGGSNKTKSDAQGRFRLEKVPPRSWAYPLWAHQGNLITQIVSVPSLIIANPKVAKFTPLRLEMSEGKQAKFLVTSEITQQPIAGATVRFGYPDRRLVTTDARGQAIVPGLLPKAYGGAFDVTIEAEDHARSAPQIELSQAEKVTEFKIALTMGGIVRGKVIDAEGKPVSEVNIGYRINNGVGFPGDAHRSDADGNFRHSFLPLDVPIEVSARKKDYLPQEQEVTLTATQRESVIQFVLPSRPNGGSVAGVVTDESGKLIVGANVTNHGNNGDDKHESKTDADGRFVIHDMFKGLNRYEVGVAAKGFAPQLIEVDPGTENQPAVISVTLKPGHAIQGRVTLETGKPAKGALVSIRSGVFHFGVGQTITVDDEGHFQFDSLPDDVRFDVLLPGYAHLVNLPFNLDGADPVTITLESPGIIRGRVVDARTRKPIPQFRVRLGFSRSRKRTDPQGTYDGTWSQTGVTFESDDGKFIVEPLTDGFPVELIVESEGYLRHVMTRAVAAKKEQAREFKISLEPNDPRQAFTLTGQFLDHRGEPKAGAELRLIVSTDQPTDSNDNNFNWELIKGGQLGQKSYCEQFLSGVTDAKGRFEFKNILPNKYLQLAYWGSGVPQGRSLEFDETSPGASEDVTIRLPEPAKIRGTIVRENFPDAGSVRLSLNLPGWHTYEIKLGDDQAEFEFDDLPAGDFSLMIGSKPVRFTENGNTLFRISPLAHQKIQLDPGQVETISFIEPDTP